MIYDHTNTIYQLGFVSSFHFNSFELQFQTEPNVKRVLLCLHAVAVATDKWMDLQRMQIFNEYWSSYILNRFRLYSKHEFHCLFYSFFHFSLFLFFRIPLCARFAVANV